MAAKLNITPTTPDHKMSTWTSIEEEDDNMLVKLDWPQ